MLNQSRADLGIPDESRLLELGISPHAGGLGGRGLRSRRRDKAATLVLQPDFAKPEVGPSVYLQYRGLEGVQGGVVVGIFLLLAASTVVGFVLGYFYFYWIALVVSGLVLASATAWMSQGFGIGSGIAAIVGCLTLNQLAFFYGCLIENKPKARSRRVTSLESPRP